MRRDLYNVTVEGYLQSSMDVSAAEECLEYRVQVHCIWPDLQVRDMHVSMASRLRVRLL